MATNFPSSLDTSTQQPTIASSDEMDDSGKEHDVVHTNHSGAIIALETKLGSTDSNPSANAVLMGTGSGTSAWDTTPTFTGLVTASGGIAATTLSLSAVPAFRATNTDSSTVNVQGAAVWVCDTDSGTGCYDNGNNFNTSTGYFTAPVDGYYHFTWHLFLYTTYDNDSNCYFGLYSSNGSAYTNHGIKGSDGGQQVSAIFYLDASDTCYPYIVSSGLDITSYTGQVYNSFQGILIG